MIGTDDLIKWLLEQIDADERDALGEGHFSIDEGGYYSCPATRAEPLGDLEWGEENCDCGLAARRSRALAECVSKRRIIADVIPAVNGLDDRIESEWGHGGEGPHEESLLLLQLLALPYVHRPGFEEAWRP